MANWEKSKKLHADLAIRYISKNKYLDIKPPNMWKSHWSVGVFEGFPFMEKGYWEFLNKDSAIKFAKEYMRSH